MKPISFIACLACTLLPTSDWSGPVDTAVAYPPRMVDGRCDEHPDVAENHYRLSGGIDLYVSQDDDFVWLCYTIPVGANSWLDMYVEAPALEHALNLHASAQLGEWPADSEGPDNATSDQWWRVSGWTANTARFNGHSGRGADRRARFKPSEGRELQLGKHRFGRGNWGVQLHIHGIETGVAPNGTIFFPEDVGDGPELLLIQVH